MTTTPDIFLSYNREDAAMARHFAEGFEAAGFEVWWDQALRSGEAYDEVTEAALRGAKAVVVLWSPRSVTSRWVRAEATIGERNGTLVPVKIEPCDLPVMFELTQTADLCHWRGAEDDKEWLAFLGDVRRMVGKKPEAKVAPVTSQSNAGSGIATVAVLPIAYRGGDDEMEFLAEDLTEDITREVGHRRLFKVVAASTMAASRGKAIDNQALARQLDARFLVEAKLQKTGESVRLTAQLIDADTANMVWSSRTVRKLADIADGSEEMAVAVAAELGDQIIQIEVNRAMAKPGPYDAWEHIFRYLGYLGRIGSDSIYRAIEEARQAVALAPDNGIAHAILAGAISQLKVIGLQELDDVMRHEVQTHIKRALQVDGDNPTVIHQLVGPYSALGDFDTMLRLARRAVELYPNAPLSHFMLGDAYLRLGRIAEAIAAYGQQDQMTPFDRGRYHGLANLGICYLLEGQPTEAEAALDRSLAIHPEYSIALAGKAIVAAHRGEEQLALATVMRLREVEPEMGIDQHVRHVVRSPTLSGRMAEHIETLRRLWAETEPEG